MIAYNHHIEFIPKLKKDKKINPSYLDSVTIEENSTLSLDNQFLYKMTFFKYQKRNLSLYADKAFNSTQKGNFWAFRVKGVVTFFWKHETLHLEYVKEEYFTEKLLEYWCLHTLLPIFFSIEERYDFLHASAVELDGNSILFTAKSFGGKSTILDLFMKKGHNMISDDKVAIVKESGLFYAVPSYPYCRPYRKMEDLGFFVESFTSKLKPIYTVYELVKVKENGAVAIRKLKGMEKFRSLRNASDINICFLKLKRFKFLTQMTDGIDVYRVNIPWNIKRLNEVYSSITKHQKTLTPDTKDG